MALDLPARDFIDWIGGWGPALLGHAQLDVAAQDDDVRGIAVLLEGDPVHWRLVRENLERQRLGV